jgi:cell division protein FtsZ
MGNRLSVTLISSLANVEDETIAPVKPAIVAKAKPAARPEPEPEPELAAPPPPPIWEQPAEVLPPAAAEEATPVIEWPTVAPELVQADEPASVEPEPAPVAEAPEEPFIEEPPAQPRVILPKKKPAPFKEPKPVAEKKPLAKQEVMQFEPVTRGRFEKSEPTIVEGQDLDVPTFLRKNVRVK